MEAATREGMRSDPKLRSEKRGTPTHSTSDAIIMMMMMMIMMMIIMMMMVVVRIMMKYDHDDHEYDDYAHL